MDFFSMLFLLFMWMLIIFGKAFIMAGLFSIIYLPFSCLYRDLFPPKKINIEKQKIWFYNLWLPSIIASILLGIYLNAHGSDIFNYLMEFPSRQLTGKFKDFELFMFVGISVLEMIFYLVYQVFYAIFSAFSYRKYHGTKVIFIILGIFLILFLIMPFLKFLYFLF